MACKKKITFLLVPLWQLLLVIGLYFRFICSYLIDQGYGNEIEGNEKLPLVKKNNTVDVTKTSRHFME